MIRVMSSISTSALKTYRVGLIRSFLISLRCVLSTLPSTTSLEAFFQVLDGKSLGISHIWIFQTRDSRDLEPNFEALLQGLSNLRVLYLDDVNISASGEEWCGALARSTPKLQELSLVFCSLSDGIGISLSKLRSLSILDLEGNNLNTNIPDFFVNFTSLFVLRLGYCGLKGFFPKDIFKLKNLTIVDVSSNPMLSGSLPDFTMDSALKSLVLYDSKFSGFLPDTIGNVRSLEILDLSNCNFYEKIPSSIWNLTQLRNLILFSNNFTGLIPPFQSPSSVVEVTIAQNQKSGSIPRVYGGRGLQKLVIIDLSNNSLSGPIPETLFNLPQLQALLLWQNQLSGQLPVFVEASLLKNIDLSNNNLQGKISTALFQLSGLEFLSLAMNNFTGFFQLDSMLFLKNLSYLDLSNNNINGEIPTLIGNLVSLYLLNMSRNALTGPIPHQLGSLTQLKYLDLSKNHLYGEIPLELVSLMFLSALNLSYNNLVGRIPKGGLFSTFSNTSFEGNVGLCRFPCNTLVEMMNNISISPPTLDDIENKSYMIILGILFGVGFGGSMAIVIVLDVLCFDRSKRRNRRTVDG
ncbi:probable LRR receptor-like serine/threonine-protein kinase At1g34110 isoform X2 [Dendrobium catenatum]|uniref:probable LRR receptor-like serine/threonine-protein kinase At1g34110 isoform X2 n=1 Tax=Dendrobium catenatum TaxID=906689 RepID=UPI00109FAC07|nr:probable LRR receptor-like serine/threonine-protein kinase At1g34110 isoform X2 [Dendrobium catenatum]